MYHLLQQSSGMLMQQIIDRLSHTYPSLSPQMQRAASTILDDPGAVAVDSMRSLAARAKVSPPTMLRLAQKIGFPSYDAFRDVFKKSVARGGYGDRADALRDIIGEGGISGLMSKTATAAIAGIERLSEPRYWREIERAAEMIVAARKTYVVASGASFGQAVSFQYVCQMALPSMELANRIGTRAVDGLALAGPEDLLIAIATHPYATQTVESALFAHNKGVPVVTVTDRRTSPIAAIAAAAIFIDTDSPHYFPSMVCLDATLEVLSAAVAVTVGPDAVRSISEYEKTLRSSGYYWEDPND